MKASYGHTDGSRGWYLTIDMDRCDGCARCMEACPMDVFRVEFDDYDEMKAVVVEEHRKRIKDMCGRCGPVRRSSMRPCHIACPTDAIAHSW